MRRDAASGKYDYANPFHKVFARLILRPGEPLPSGQQLKLESLTLHHEEIVRILGEAVRKLRRPE